MPLATPEADSPTSGPMPTPISSSGRRSTRLHRFDLIGVSGVVVAGAALAGTLLLLREQSAGPTAPPQLATPVSVIEAPVRSVAPSRDQWYLEAPRARPLPQDGTPALMLKDRWYQDTPTTPSIPLRIPPVRDQWYLNAARVRSAPSVSIQVRDRWYQEQQTGR